MVLVEAFKDPSHKTSITNDKNLYIKVFGVDAGWQCSHEQLGGNIMMAHCHVCGKGRALMYAPLRYNGSRQWGLARCAYLPNKHDVL